MKKKIFGIVLALVCVLSCGLCFTACATTMNRDQANDYLFQAATNFFRSHRDVNNYADSTYHWVEEKTIMQKDEIRYNVEGSENEVTEIVENKTVTTTEMTIAMKSVNGHIVSEINVVKTTVRTGAEVEDGERKEVNDTTVETGKYRSLVYDYVESDDSITQKKIYLGEITVTENGNVTTNQKVYAKKVYYSDDTETNIESYDETISSLVSNVNYAIDRDFFNVSEFFIYSRGTYTVEQDGNQVRIARKSDNQFALDTHNSSAYNLVDAIISYSIEVNYYYKDKNICKADYRYSERGENSFKEKKITFDYEDGAVVDMQFPADLSGYGDVNYYYATGWSSAASNFPYFNANLN